MTIVETHALLSDRVVPAARIDWGSAPLVTVGAESAEQQRQAWQDVIDHKLIEWGRNPQQLEDDGVVSPCNDVVRLAIWLSRDMQQRGFPPPSSVVPDANGGIVFEHRQGRVAEIFHIWEDGAVEYQLFDGTQLVERQLLSSL